MSWLCRCYGRTVGGTGVKKKLRRNKKVETFKGTDRDMECCGGYQYTLGEKNTDDGAIRCGNKGFHSCEAPMDVLRYFPARDGNRYFTAEAGGDIDRSGADDSKIASSELTIKAEIGLPGIIRAHMEYTRKTAVSYVLRFIFKSP